VPKAVSRDYPRVLILNASPFGDHSATGITLSNLFRGWPTERLALVYADTNTANPGANVCIRNWPLSFLDVPVYRNVRTMLVRSNALFFGFTVDRKPGRLSVAVGEQQHSRGGWLHDIARAWSDLLPYCPSCEFWNWVTEFQPDVIYTMMGSIRLLRLAEKLAARLCVPIVPHYMDDWPTTLYLGWPNWVPRRVMLSCMDSVLRRSPHGLSIGPSMSAEYEQRYGMKFFHFMNCVDVPDRCEPLTVLPESQPVRFLFFGGLHLERWRCLESVGRALMNLHEQGYEAELIVYTSKSDIANYCEFLSTIPRVHLYEMLPLDSLVPALKGADILLHVDSFDVSLRRYLRFSTSTKLPLCMATGKPLLVYGPRELGSSGYVLDCQCGVVVSEQDTNLLSSTMQSLICDPANRAELGRNGWIAAKKNHSGVVVRSRFRTVLADAAAVGQAQAQRYFD
jgi:hypothetical protein